jgi:hypothetical protein
VNPYEAAAIDEPPGYVRRSAWRMVPAVLSVLLGVAYIYIMVVLAHVSIAVSDLLTGTRRPAGERLLEAFLSEPFSILIGICWIVSGILFWRTRYRKASYIALAAFATLLVRLSY